MKWNLNSSVSVQSLYVSLYLYSRKACREKFYFHQANEEKQTDDSLKFFSFFLNTTKVDLQIQLPPITAATVTPPQLACTEQDPCGCQTPSLRDEDCCRTPWVPLPMETPQWEPQRLMLLSEMAAMRIWSNARVKKVAKVLAKAMVLSRVAQPTAMLTWKRDIGQEQWIPHLSVVSRTLSVRLLALKISKKLSTQIKNLCLVLLLIAGVSRKERRQLTLPVSILLNLLCSMLQLPAVTVHSYWQLLFFICLKQPFKDF